jgi:hypothetical protein
VGVTCGNTCKFDGGIGNCVTQTYDICESDSRSDSDVRAGEAKE